MNTGWPKKILYFHSDEESPAIRTCARAGKKNYARADRLLQEIAREIEPGQIIKVGEKNGLQLIDKFFEQDMVWTPCAARRWELAEVDL